MTIETIVLIPLGGFTEEISIHNTKLFQNMFMKSKFWLNKL